MKKQEPIYVFTNWKNKTYYCDKCNTIKKIKYCRRCHIKLNEDKEFDNVNDINISSESEREPNDSQSSYEEMSDRFVVRDKHFTNNDDYELLSEEEAFKQALGKFETKLDPFKYIVKQNCKIVNNNVISSDEELVMDDSSESKKNNKNEKSKCYL